MKKVLFALIMLVSFLGAKAQQSNPGNIVPLQGCWNVHEKTYYFKFYQSGEGLNPTQVLSYALSEHGPQTVIPNQPIISEYSIPVEKENNSPEDSPTLYVFFNGVLTAVIKDSNNMCPKSLPIKYKEGSFILRGEPHILEINH